MKLTSVMGPTAIVVISVVLSPLHAGSYGPFTLQDFQTSSPWQKSSRERF